MKRGRFFCHLFVKVTKEPSLFHQNRPIFIRTVTDGRKADINGRSSNI